MTYNGDDSNQKPIAEKIVIKEFLAWIETAKRWSQNNTLKEVKEVNKNAEYKAFEDSLHGFA